MASNFKRINKEGILYKELSDKKESQPITIGIKKQKPYKTKKMREKEKKLTQKKLKQKKKTKSKTITEEMKELKRLLKKYGTKITDL